MITSRETLEGGLTDDKSYRLVHLSNGLECLLIHLAEPMNEKNEAFSESEEEEEDLDDDADDDDNDDDDEEETEGKAPQRAACAMAVGVGSWADPECRPGCAHFLEHMLFMGTAKYTKENEYEVYLSKHGGSCNAETELEWTCYHFDVANDFLEGALDRFSNFFVEPLMREDAVGREVRSIEAEFQETIRCDEARMDELLFRQVGIKPFDSFAWGNAQSLHKGDTVARDMMKKIFQEHYHASNMKFAIISTSSFEDLESMILASALPRVRTSPKLPLQPFSTTSAWRRSSWHSRPLRILPIQTSTVKACSLVRIIPLAERLSLRLIWHLDPISCLTDWAQRTEDVCAHILGHEGTASATAELRRRGFITDLIAGTGTEGYSKSAACGSWFIILIHLTPAGLAQWPMVVDIIFKYAAKCHAELEKQSKEETDELLNELAQITTLKFDYGEQYDHSIEIVEDLSISMLPLYSADQPRSQLLRFNAGCFIKPDPVKLKAMLFILQNVNACHSIQLLSTEFLNASTKSIDNDTHNVLQRNSRLGTVRPDRAPEIEARFGTEYWRDELDPELLEYWASPNNEYDLSLPEKNAFLPKSLSLLPPSRAVSIAAFEDAAAKIDFHAEHFQLKAGKLPVQKKRKKLALPPPPQLIGKTYKNDRIKKDNQVSANESAATLWTQFRRSTGKEETDEEFIIVPREVDASPFEFAPGYLLCKRLPRFERPLAQIRLRLFSPVMLQGAGALAHCERAVARSLEIIAEQAYAATTADLHYSVHSSEASVILKFGGWSEPLPRLLDLVLKETVTQLQHWGDKDLTKYAAADDKYCRALRNAWFVDSAKQARDMRLILLCPELRASPTAKLLALSSEDVSAPKEFLVDALMHGNVDESYGETVKAIIEQHTGSRVMSYDRPPVRVARLASREIRIIQGSIDDECPTTALEMYWQLGPDDAALRVATELLESILEEPLYDRLRTQEQLGYTCSCGSRWTAGVVGFGIRLVSDKASPEKLQERLRVFLSDFRQNVLGLIDHDKSSKKRNITNFADFVQNDFLDHCKGLALGKLEQESISDVTDKDWTAVLDRLPFSTSIVEAIALRYITPQALCSTFDRIFGFGPPPHAPCLITATVGRGAPWLSAPHAASSTEYPVPPRALLDGTLYPDDTSLLAAFQQYGCNTLIMP